MHQINAPLNPAGVYPDWAGAKDFLGIEIKYLEQSHPELVKEWHSTRNENPTPHKINSGSNKKAWWKCEKGHEWESVIASRVNGIGCPYCANQRVCKDNCLSTTHSYLVQEWHHTKNDKLNPDNVCAGSNKKVWWKCKKKHEWQTSISKRADYGRGCPYCTNKKVCKDNCLSATHPELSKEWHPTKNRLTPNDVVSGSHKKVWWRCRQGHNWEAAIAHRTKNHKPTGCPYCTNQKINNENCLATLLPEIAKEWHPTKNGNLTPDKISHCSGQNVWWKCTEGHEWQAVASSRKNGCGCPFCSGRRVCIDSCFSTTHPELSKEWHPIKNGNLTPKDVSRGSHRKVWWKCKKGHEWESNVYCRTNISGCPYCSGQKINKENCFSTTHPELLNEWHPTKNGKLTPEKVSFGSGLKVWWRCSKGHEWETAIGSRTRGTGCPYCAGRKVCKDNCLSTTHPELSKEWHPTKNGNLTPKDISYGSERIIWWKCKKGHEWQSTSNRRTSKKCCCPYCSNHYSIRNKDVSCDR